MNGHHERSLDDPRPPAEDRPVAGRPTSAVGRAETAAETEPVAAEPRIGADPEPAVETAADTADEPTANTEAAGPWSEADTEPAAETAAGTAPTANTEPVTTGPSSGADAEPAGSGSRPADADELAVDRLVDADAVRRFRERWRDVKGDFVDDPAGAVRQASALSGEAVDELVAALGRLRGRLDGHWGEGEEADTERLRVALRGYGSLIDRVLGH
ncbi:hypothetical protein OG417_23505 [Actinoallomurus sp. NBC_01490]|uniref:hypothetical protein n=1 Tax=Actinoallomurus sp. NBC_01490 TaxID=2903557 RepID=UPI002E335B63|nr:hypothetical protein [Actinoallomurus sp. NBC_01490]